MSQFGNGVTDANWVEKSQESELSALLSSKFFLQALDMFSTGYWLLTTSTTDPSAINCFHPFTGVIKWL